MTQDRIEERLHGLALGFHVWLGVATHAATKQVWKIALVVVGAKLEEQVENLVNCHLGIDAGPVNLVDENNRAQTLFQSFFQHKAGLRHRSFVGVNDQQTTIHHAQHPLHLTAEVCVPRRVNNVDTNAFVINGGVFGENCDPALPLEIVRVHHTGWNRLSLSEDARLVEHGIHQCGFAMVDVGNDRNVANWRAWVCTAHTNKTLLLR